MYAHLTSGELRRAYSAADYLFAKNDLLKMDQSLAAKLSTLRSDLAAEVEDRQGIERESTASVRSLRG